MRGASAMAPLARDGRLCRTHLPSVPSKWEARPRTISAQVRRCGVFG